MKKHATQKILCLMLMICIFASALFPATTYAAAPSISASKITLTQGMSKTLKIKNAKKKTSWSSSNKKVATVSGSGKITAKKPGTAKITAKNNGKKYYCSVTVKAKKTVAKPKLNVAGVILYEGMNYQFSMQNTKKKVTWSSSNKKVFTVNSSGRITAKKAGKAKVTAKVNGKKYTASVKVKKKAVSNQIPTVTPTPAPDYSHENTDLSCQAALAHPVVKNVFNRLKFTVEFKPMSDFSGYFSVKEHKITLKRPGSTIYHELGHFLAWISGNADTTTEWTNIYNAEKGFVTIANKYYVTKNASEYFAESYKDYVLNNNYLKSNRPRTYDYISGCLTNVEGKTDAYWDNIYKAYNQAYWK